MPFSAAGPMGNKSDGSDYQAVQLLQTTFVFGVFFLMTFFSSFNLFLSQLILFFPFDLSFCSSFNVTTCCCHISAHFRLRYDQSLLRFDWFE